MQILFGGDSNFKVDNLTAFLDWNSVQATGHTKDVFNIPDLDKKWASFGWHVINADGHKVDVILAAIEEAETVKGKPSLIILKTIKGKAFSFAEGNPAYHNGTFTEETHKQALKELDAIKAGL